MIWAFEKVCMVNQHCSHVRNFFKSSCIEMAFLEDERPFFAVELEKTFFQILKNI
jgi:hypothetical protein